MDETMEPLLIKTVLSYYPAVQGIYLFGSYGTEDEWPDSDIDIALLMPHEQAKQEKNLILSPCRFELEKALHREVDLLNARQVSTVFQMEIIGRGRLIHCADRYPFIEDFRTFCLTAPEISNLPPVLAGAGF